MKPLIFYLFYLNSGVVGPWARLAVSEKNYVTTRDNARGYIEGFFV
jgi:hypothetical protein